MSRLVCIAHNKLGDHPTSDEADVLEQVTAVQASLERQGYRIVTLGLTLDMSMAYRELAALHPCCIFNLVESLDGDDRFAPAAAMLFESLNIPFTGSPSAAIAATSHKGIAKKILATAHLPTPAWIHLDSTEQTPLDFPFIMKSATDHASIGISDTSVIADASSWEAWLRATPAAKRRGMIAESYINGREFNISLLQEKHDAVSVLPPAEIVFDGFPEGKPRIVGYAAKWDHETFEYQHTRRIFPDASCEVELYARLRTIAADCFALFSLGGYARVDFRISGQGEPAILEVNTNPCLSPDAGFYAACLEHRLDYDGMVASILDSALSRTLF
jgi:D-alanine-D-alanine ligase